MLISSRDGDVGEEVAEIYNLWSELVVASDSPETFLHDSSAYLHNVAS